MERYMRVLLGFLWNPRSFQSDYCRAYAPLVAEMASRGHISCMVNGCLTGKWYVTFEGQKFLKENGMEV